MFSDPRRADVVVAQSLWAHVWGPVAKDCYRTVERPTRHAVGFRALALALKRSRVRYYERRSLAVAVSKQQSALAVTQNRPVVRRSLVIRVSYANSTSHREGSLAGAMLKGPHCHAVLTGS